MTTRNKLGTSEPASISQMLMNARDDQIRRLLRDIRFDPHCDTQPISDAPHDQA